MHSDQFKPKSYLKLNKKYVFSEGEQLPLNEVRRIHHTAGHPGIRRTFYFARRALPNVPKSVVRDVVLACETCLIDPAPVKWKKGEMSVATVWERVAMDITHFRGGAYIFFFKFSSNV